MQAVLIGAGQRGRIYADYMQEARQAEMTAIVEPHAQRLAAPIAGWSTICHRAVVPPAFTRWANAKLDRLWPRRIAHEHRR